MNELKKIKIFAKVTMIVSVVTSLIVGLFLLFTAILGTNSPFFYSLSNVPELYSLATGGTFGGIKALLFALIIGLILVLLSMVLIAVCTLPDEIFETDEEGNESTTENTRENAETHILPKQQVTHKTIDIVDNNGKENKPFAPTEEQKKETEKALDLVFNSSVSSETTVSNQIKPVEESTTENVDFAKPEAIGEFDGTSIIEKAGNKEQPAEKTEPKPIYLTKAEPTPVAEEIEKKEETKQKQYISSKFKAVYSKLPRNYKIPKENRFKDKEGNMHVHLLDSYFKISKSGDIFDEEPWE